MLFYQVTSKLYFTNSGINFFLYCISGQKFRNDLKELLGCNKPLTRCGTRSGASQSSGTDISTVN